jgi:phosphinothricin acetyltransferase
MSERVAVRDLAAADWPAVRAIYAAGIATGHATFDTEPPDWPVWDELHLARPRLVAVEPAASQVVGWAALTPVSERCVYAGVAEVSVYVDPAAAGHEVGTALLGRLVEAAEAAGLWTLQAGVLPENAASLALHRRAGFRVVGVRERIGQLAGTWRDVVLLERRSDVVGVRTPAGPGTG